MPTGSISVSEAFAIIADHLVDFGIEEVALNASQGRILREDIFADRDMPPFDRVAMDGIAVQFASIEKGIREFHIAGMVAAGSIPATLSGENDCMEIMTGSALPPGADTIIPYEWLTINNGKALLQKDQIKKGQNIHRKGNDRSKGDLLIRKGNIVGPGQTGILASVGKSRVQVGALPRILIISTGNELVKVEAEPLAHQLRASNASQIEAALMLMNIPSRVMHYNDDFNVILDGLKENLPKYDVIIISGGMSAGKFDFIPEALKDAGVKQHFYKVKQRPGKPFLFGSHPDGCVVFGIPGNPVSSYLCYVRYIRPWLELCLKKEQSPPTFAKLAEDVSFLPALTYFLTVQLQQNNNAETIAIPMKGHGSGDLTILADADAFTELPEERDLFRAGEIFPCYRFSF